MRIIKNKIQYFFMILIKKYNIERNVFLNYDFKI